jgi:hypothetical protein
MSQIRRNPAVSDRATPTTSTLLLNSNRAVNPCEVRGCVWRGTCPIHDTGFPPAYNAVTDIIRRRPYGPADNLNDCALDLDPEVRMRRLVFRIAVTEHWMEIKYYRSTWSRCAADPFTAALRTSWESLAGAVAA